MTRHDHGRPRAADAPTTTTKAPKRGLQSFLGVSTFLALVLAAGGTPAEAGGYYFRGKSVPIPAAAAAAAAAAAPVPGAAEWVGGSLVLRARTTYTTARDYAPTAADAKRAAPPLDRVATINGGAWAFLTTQNWFTDRFYMADKIGEQVRPFYASAEVVGMRIVIRTGGQPLTLAPTSPEGAAVLRALDLREVTP